MRRRASLPSHPLDQALQPWGRAPLASQTALGFPPFPVFHRRQGREEGEWGEGEEGRRGSRAPRHRRCDKTGVRLWLKGAGAVAARGGRSRRAKQEAEHHRERLGRAVFAKPASPTPSLQRERRRSLLLVPPSVFSVAWERTFEPPSVVRRRFPMNGHRTAPLFL
jgi:hypothetical protein